MSDLFEWFHDLLFPKTLQWGGDWFAPRAPTTTVIRPGALIPATGPGDPVPNTLLAIQKEARENLAPTVTWFQIPPHDAGRHWTYVLKIENRYHSQEFTGRDREDVAIRALQWIRTTDHSEHSDSPESSESTPEK